jgi:hypothetical protein
MRVGALAALQSGAKKVACDRQQGHTRITCLCMQAHWVWSEALSAGGARWDGARWPHQGAWIGLLGARAYPPVWVVRPGRAGAPEIGLSGLDDRPPDQSSWVINK